MRFAPLGLLHSGDGIQAFFHLALAAPWYPTETYAPAKSPSPGESIRAKRCWEERIR